MDSQGIRYYTRKLSRMAKGETERLEDLTVVALGNNWFAFPELDVINLDLGAAREIVCNPDLAANYRKSAIGRTMQKLRKSKSGGHNGGRPKSGAPRCPCGLMTAKLAKLRCHHCSQPVK